MFILNLDNFKYFLGRRLNRISVGSSFARKLRHLRPQLLKRDLWIV
ncbi:hypothetical protein L3N51_01885 [Metallosphaera sp. J1]|nr:hypothetical protein [Metallosphaera javensis (ex Hofmann et al. 2022)]